MSHLPCFARSSCSYPFCSYRFQLYATQAGVYPAGLHLPVEALTPAWNTEEKLYSTC